MNYKSHIGQDRWVAEVFKYKRHGLFFEAGGLDGVLSSNTYCLEKELDWQGIVVEANPTYYPALCKNRNCITINAALWRESRQQLEMVDAHGLSSAIEHVEDGTMADMRKSITLRQFSIDTINPMELLERFAAPKMFHYLSLDIEGAEVEFLKAFDFNQHLPALMTIEHCNIPERQAEIRSLVLPHGYEVESGHYDDWFWNPVVLESLGGANPREIFHAVMRTYPRGEDPKPVFYE